ncbi:MAG TPA: tetratricopeptide repeat protein [Acidimicrobiales bacterium]|nr:tetratricopeptide repeat protein [Acidimicrobiales bacterium]
MSLDPEAREAERDFLLRSIADLDAERAAGDIEAEDYAALREDYVARAAEAIRAMETGARPTALTREPRRHRGLFVVAACVLVALGAGVALANAAGSRRAGEPVSGSLPTTNSDRLQRASELVGEGHAAEAVKLYDEILEDDPEQPVALAYRGWIVRLAGLKDEGLTYLDRAVAADPSYPDAHFFRGMMLWQDKSDPASAVAEFRLFLSNRPPRSMVPLVEDALRRASAEAGTPTG